MDLVQWESEWPWVRGRAIGVNVWDGVVVRIWVGGRGGGGV